MNVIETILTRRSVRKFTSEKISDDILDILLQTALYAPTGGNHQETRFIAVRDEAILEKLRLLVRETFAARPLDPSSYQNKTAIVARKPHYDYSYHAPLLIIAVAPKEHGNSMADCALALENIMIAANSMNLGSCYINQLHWLTDDEKMRNVLQGIGVHEDENCFGSVIVGHPREPMSKELPDRVDNRIVKC